MRRVLGPLNKCSVTNPVLLAPNLCQSFYRLVTDASAWGVGSVLMQEDSSDVDRPVDYFSKMFATYQRNYLTVE